MSDDLKERLSDMSVLSQSRTPADALKHIEELEAALSEQIQWVRELADDLIAAEGREAKLKTKLAKKDGCLEETYRRWKNGADLRVLAKAEGCTQERMRHKMKRYEEDKVRLLEAKLAKAAEHLEWFIENDETYRGDEPMPERRNQTWDEINSYWIEHLDAAIAFVLELKGEK